MAMFKKKMIAEKKTGEKYASKSAKAKHEGSESKKEMGMEYGKKTAAKKIVAKKTVAKKAAKKK
jgi:hypothetical protein